jgi:hypothetical protein
MHKAGAFQAYAAVSLGRSSGVGKEVVREGMGPGMCNSLVGQKRPLMRESNSCRFAQKNPKVRAACGRLRKSRNSLDSKFK